MCSAPMDILSHMYNCHITGASVPTGRHIVPLWWWWSTYWRNFRTLSMDGQWRPLQLASVASDGNYWQNPTGKCLNKACVSSMWGQWVRCEWWEWGKRFASGPAQDSTTDPKTLLDSKSKSPAAPWLPICSWQKFRNSTSSETQGRYLVWTEEIRVSYNELDRAV